MTTRMRHPAPDVPGEITIPDEAVSLHRMSGWLTDDEWARAGLPEPEPDEEPQDDVPDGESGEQEKTRPRRSRPRATSEGNED